MQFCLGVNDGGKPELLVVVSDDLLELTVGEAAVDQLRRMMLGAMDLLDQPVGGR